MDVARHLGHPSLAYLKHLFPSLKNVVLSLDCETCVLAKSHKHCIFLVLIILLVLCNLYILMCGGLLLDLLIVYSLIMFYL